MYTIFIFCISLVIGFPIQKKENNFENEIQNTKVIKFMESAGIQMHINTFIWYLKFKIVSKKMIRKINIPQ